MTYLLLFVLAVAAFVIWRYALVPPPGPVSGRPLLDDALAHTPVSVIRLDAEGHVVSLHGGWEQCTGVRRRNDRQALFGLHPSRGSCASRALEDRLRESALTEVSGTMRLTARAGTVVTSEVRVYPQREHSGRVTGAVLIATPAAGRQTGIRLFEAGVLPEPSSVPTELNATTGGALGRTLAGLAHELNNPLAVISGFAQILLRSSPTPEDRHAIESILNEARRATNLIRDVITVARGEASRPAERVDLNALVMSAIAQFRPTLESKGITFTATLSESELSVEGVPAQMDRVVHNLIRNAQRHLAHCSSSACVLSVTTTRAGDEVVLEVADSGPELSAEELERIWDPFAVTGDEADVSGFELAVARSLVTAQGGSIAVSVFRAGNGFRSRSARQRPRLQRRHGPLDVLGFIRGDVARTAVAIPGVARSRRRDRREWRASTASRRAE
jgi:signal transduction histidine kinase